MNYNEHFEKHYRSWLEDMSASRLIEYEQNLSRFIDSDLFSDSPLSDETIVLYELIRDECVKRVAIMSQKTT